MKTVFALNRLPCVILISMFGIMGTANLVFCATADATEQNSQTSVSKEAAEDEEEAPMLEASRAEAREATEWAARTFDSWFGDIPFEQGGKVSRGRVRFRTVWRENDDVDVKLRFRARMELPNLKDKAYVIIGRENKDNLVRDTPEGFIEQQHLFERTDSDDEAFFAGLGFKVLDQLSFSVGLRDLYKPYTKARYGYEWTFLEDYRADFRETVFWVLDDGFGSTTTLHAERMLTPTLSLGWHGSGTVSEDEDGLDWSTSLGAYKNFDVNRQLSLEILANGDTGDVVNGREYGVLTQWRQPLYHDWFFGEASVGYYWEREEIEDAREGKWALGFGVEMLF